MTDRENVIVELTDSIEILSDFDTQEYTFRERQQLHGSVIAAIQDALALLKAQEPKPPIIKENSYGWRFYYCPSCEKEFYQNNKFSFCDKCGQAVNWNG